MPKNALEIILTILHFYVKLITTIFLNYKAMIYIYINQI